MYNYITGEITLNSEIYDTYKNLQNENIAVVQDLVFNCDERDN